MDQNNSLGYWIRRRRKALDLTQHDLACQMDCAVSTIRKWEADLRRPTRNILERLADSLALTSPERETFLLVARNRRRPDELALPVGPAASQPPRWPPRPVPLTPLVGRAQQVAEVCICLRREEVRLVTLKGPGGIGKTRLALAVATEIEMEFSDGAVFVDLAAVRDPDLLAAAIAQTLGLVDAATSGRSQSPLKQLQVYLREKRLLLVLDNFEQIVAASVLLTDLLAATLGLKVLVTSRSALCAYGEYEYDVPPLALVDQTRLLPTEQMLAIESVRLFVTRVQAIQPDFQITLANAPAVAAICARLDGLPLAIELAAARGRLFAPEALLARLTSRLQFLTSGARNLPLRQQTIRATIAWSYALLALAEQRLFQRLGVFDGGWTLEGAEAVTDASGDLGMNVLDGLTALVTQSLVRQVIGSNAEPRFRRLETIREYALEQLEASGEAMVMRRRHAMYYLDLAEAGDRCLRGPQQITWLERLDAEHDNLQAALGWCEKEEEWELLGRLVAALGRFWYLRGQWGDARHWFELARRAMHAISPSRTRDRWWSTALFNRVFLANSESDVVAAAALSEECLALEQGYDDPRARSTALMLVGTFTNLPTDPYWPHRRAFLAESVALAREGSDPWLLSLALCSLARHHWDNDSGRLLEESLTLAQATGDPWLIAHILRFLGICRIECQGDYAGAIWFFEQSLVLHRASRSDWDSAVALSWLSNVDYARGEYAIARARQTERLQIEERLGNREGRENVLYALAQIASAEGQHAEAHTLMAGYITHLKERGDPWQIAQYLNAQGDLDRLVGDDSSATLCYKESLSLSREVGNSHEYAWSCSNLAYLALHQHDVAKAVASFRESLQVFRDEHDKEGITTCMRGLAEIHQVGGDPARAARLLAAAEALGASSVQDKFLANRAEYARIAAAVRAELDEGSFMASWAKGSAMAIEQAIADAIGELTEPLAQGWTRANDHLESRLTKREVEVLCLVAEGYTDQDVAVRLGLRHRTVTSYLTSIYAKLEVGTRTAAVRVAREHQFI